MSWGLLLALPSHGHWEGAAQGLGVLSWRLGVHAAPRTPAATPGPASRPPWAVDPSFAERYAPDKTSTVVSKHSQPATPTPMQNRSSIVQAAQQAPEGPGRTPLCYKCNKVIR